MRTLYMLYQPDEDSFNYESLEFYHEKKFTAEEFQEMVTSAVSLVGRDIYEILEYLIDHYDFWEEYPHVTATIEEDYIKAEYFPEVKTSV